MGARKMSAENTLRILIQSNPLWQQQIPVHVKTVYTVLARKQTQWQTILSSTDDLHAARRAMDAANATGLFDRLVIAEGRSVNKAPAGNFKTIECALPQPKIISQSEDFAALLGRLQKSTANLNPAENDLPRATQTQIIGEKENCVFALGVALFLTIAHLNPLLLCLVGFLAFTETMFLADTRPLDANAARRFNALRHWGYALLNGALLLPLVLKFLL